MVAKQYNEGFVFEHLCGLMSFRLNSIAKNVKWVVLPASIWYFSFMEYTCSMSETKL